MDYLQGRSHFNRLYSLLFDRFAHRFIFSARMSPEDIHKRYKRDIETTMNENIAQSCTYPSLTHIMYFIHLMHQSELFKLKISQPVNEILIRTHNEYNNMVIGFQGYQDVLCTLFSKARDHLYRVCGLLHLLHQACIYVLQVRNFQVFLYAT